MSQRGVSRRDRLEDREERIWEKLGAEVLGSPWAHFGMWHWEEGIGVQKTVCMSVCVCVASLLE